ncbi:MAG: carbonic anhydrase, partial [Planctomycetota bacterium]
EALTAQLAERGIDINDVNLDPAIPGLTLPQADLATWFRTFEDVDDAAVRQVELLRNHPLIPEHVTIHAYIYETESDTLRRPQARIAELTSTSPSDTPAEQTAAV